MNVDQDESSFENAINREQFQFSSSVINHGMILLREEAKDGRDWKSPEFASERAILISGLADDLTTRRRCDGCGLTKQARSVRPDLIFRSDTRLKELQGISGVAECVAKNASLGERGTGLPPSIVMHMSVRTRVTDTMNPN
ncbi:hypothetical protein K0M31_017837 [Melipona bicolor]|uniref:Uncharacterized protein n=1 Tax=Melipona bicolor TaxID=60889 RepID=A0AA40G5M1_9HYME|nr:hypothetical protein K0M31_017837 [Melipona bicolor]